MAEWTSFNEVFIPSMCVLLAILCTYEVIKRLRTRWRQRAVIRRAEKFMEEARQLTAEDAPRKPGLPGYDWKIFQADLHDGKVTFNEIWEKCGGRLPQKPEPNAEGHQGIEGFQGQAGGRGSEGANGGQGSAGPDGQGFGRMKELQEWFKKRGEDVSLRKVVPPPPAPHTVIHKIYTRGRR